MFAARGRGTCTMIYVLILRALAPFLLSSKRSQQSLVIATRQSFAVHSGVMAGVIDNFT